MGLVQSAITLILTFAALLPLLAQSGVNALGARAKAMGGASVALKDYFSPFNNIGATAHIKEIAAITSFEHKLNFLPFQHFGAGIIYPHKWGNFSFTAQKFGAELYNEQQYGLGLGNKIGIFSLGIKINYTQISIYEVDKKGVVSAALGGTADFHPKLSFGTYFYNITQSSFGEEETYNVPVIVRSGFLYTPLSFLRIAFEVEKDIDQDFRLKGGLEYTFLEKFSLRSGISSAPYQQHYGLGFNPTKFSVDYTLENHATLGLSHQLSLAYLFHKK